MAKISPIDRKILLFLAFNGIDVSEREIAKKLRLSQATVNYSIKKLEENKLIRGYCYRINHEKIGLNCMAWVFFVLKRQCFDTDVLVKKVSVFSEVQMIVALTGEYDFCISVFGKDMRQVAESISRIEKGLASFIELSSMVFVTRLFKFHQVVLPAPEEKPFELDALGKKVLSFMVENPKASVKEICKAISAHRNTVSKKIKQLNDSGVIIKKGLILDPETSEELGFGFKSMIFFNISPDKKELFAQKLCEFQEVHELFAISGHHDFLAIVRTKGTQELFDFHKRLLCNSELSPMIQRTISRVILRSMNLNHDPKRVLRGG